MPLPWKKDSKKAPVPDEAPTLPPLIPPSTSLDEVRKAIDEVVARRASDEGKEERLAAKGVELLGADDFLFEWRVYRELSKGRWDATEATTTEIAALRAGKQENPATAINVLSAGQLMPAREKKGLEKLNALFSKSSKGTAEGLQGGFIEREKAARRGSPLQNPLANAPSSSVYTLTQQSAGENLNVHRPLVSHFESIRPSRSCVDLIPLNTASAQGGQGGTRCLSDIAIARWNVFPPRNLCRTRPGSQSGMFTLSPDPNIPPELLKAYFLESSCMDISRNIAITLYRDLYDRICGLEPEGSEPKNKTKPSSKNSSDRTYRFSREENCSMDDIASSSAIIKNASQGSEDNTSFISVPEHEDGDGDVMFVNNENYAQQVDRDVQDQLSNLHAQDSDGDEILPEPLGGPNSTPFALMGSFFVAESRASLLEGEYEDVAIVAASSAGARYWGGETSSVPQDSTATKADGSFRWPGIDY
ncbi:hypothetical protein TWF217_005938 [Orbilia oligospora]|nr:hypothetical protein TWF217_005938 [Orbilia oligospora]